MAPLDDMPPRKPTDLELLRAWQAGNRMAGELLFERYYPVVARFFHNKAPDHVREDLIQETFVRSVRYAERFMERSDFRVYVLGIANKLLLNYYRERHGPRNHDELGSMSIEALEPSPSAHLAKRQDLDRLLRALRQLPMARQIGLELKYWERLTHREITVVLGISESSVKNLLYSARQRLGEILESMPASPELPLPEQDDLDQWAKELARMWHALQTEDLEDPEDDGQQP